MVPPQINTGTHLVDRDPITAGIQNQPGVVRQVGPPQVVGNMGGPRPPVMMNNIRR